MKKTKSPPSKTKVKTKDSGNHNKKINMDNVKIKRVKRNKKKSTTAQKVLAGVGVGSTLLGGIGAVSPHSEQKEFVRENESSSQKSGIKEKLGKIFKSTFGINSAKASGLDDAQAQLAEAQRALNDFNSWYNQAMADVPLFGQEDQEPRRQAIQEVMDTEGKALQEAVTSAQAALSQAQSSQITPTGGNDLPPVNNPQIENPYVMLNDQPSYTPHQEGEPGQIEAGRMGHWHFNGASWELVDNSGNIVLNPNGSYYTADGNGGWTLVQNQNTNANPVNQGQPYIPVEQVPQSLDPILVNNTNTTPQEAHNEGESAVNSQGRSGVWHKQADGSWVVIEDAGHEVTNPNGFVYISDGQNGWMLKDGQEKIDGSVRFVSQNGGWVAQASTVNYNDLTVTPDINNASTGTITVNGQQMTLSVIPGGYVFDQNGNNVTDQLRSQGINIEALATAFANAPAANTNSNSNTNEVNSNQNTQNNTPPATLNSQTTSFAPVVTKGSNGSYTVTMGSFTFTGSSVQDVERQLQNAYSTYLGYANGSVRIDLNTYNALSSALVSSATGTTVNPNGGSLGAYYEQGDVRIFKAPDGTYTIQILTNEPVYNPQTKQMGYNLILNVKDTSEIQGLINQTIGNGVNEDTKLIFTNALSDLSVFKTQENTGQLRFTFQSNPILKIEGNESETSQNSFHFATKETADAVASILNQAGLRGATVTAIPVGNLTQYLITFADTNYKGNAGLIANLIQTGGIDAAVNLIRTELAEQKGDYSTMYVGVGTGGNIGSSNYGTNTKSGSATGNITNNTTTATLPTGFAIPPGGFPAGTPLPNGLTVSGDGKNIIDRNGNVVAVNQPTNTGLTSGNGNQTAGSNTQSPTLGNIVNGSVQSGVVLTLSSTTVTLKVGEIKTITATTVNNGVVGSNISASTTSGNIVINVNGANGTISIVGVATGQASILIHPTDLPFSDKSKDQTITVIVNGPLGETVVGNTTTGGNNTNTGNTVTTTGSSTTVNTTNTGGTGAVVNGGNVSSNDQLITQLQTQITGLQNQVANLSGQLSNSNNNSGLQNQILQLNNQVQALTNLLSKVQAGQVTVLGNTSVQNFQGLQMPAGYPASGGVVTAQSQVEGASTMGTYTVKKGDTLWNIAKKYYGDGREWRKIMEANLDKVNNPKTLRIGTVLVIPTISK